MNFQLPELETDFQILEFYIKRMNGETLYSFCQKFDRSDSTLNVINRVKSYGKFTEKPQALFLKNTGLSWEGIKADVAVYALRISTPSEENELLKKEIEELKQRLGVYFVR